MGCAHSGSSIGIVPIRSNTNVTSTVARHNGPPSNAAPRVDAQKSTLRDRSRRVTACTIVVGEDTTGRGLHTAHSSTIHSQVRDKARSTDDDGSECLNQRMFLRVHVAGSSEENTYDDCQHSKEAECSTHSRSIADVRVPSAARPDNRGGASSRGIESDGNSVDPSVVRPKRLPRREAQLAPIADAEFSMSSAVSLSPSVSVRPQEWSQPLEEQDISYHSPVKNDAMSEHFHLSSNAISGYCLRSRASGASGYYNVVHQLDLATRRGYLRPEPLDIAAIKKSQAPRIRAPHA